MTAWTQSADVVVVGAGAAGVCAALEAAAGGAEVLVLNAADLPGGSALRAGGSIYLGGGTPVQRACGFQDTVEDMYGYLAEATGPDPDRAKLELYCTHSVEHFNWLVSQGATFVPKLWEKPGWAAPRGYGLMYTGGENAYPFAERFAPVARGHMVDASYDPSGSRSAGWALMDTLNRAAATVSAIRRVDRTTVDALVVDRGEVVGVSLGGGGACLVQARRGVVLCTGGFAANDAMLARYSPRLLGNAFVGSSSDDGAGLRMAQAIGAAVRHMDAGQTAIPVAPALLALSMALDGRGRRFVNEDTYPGRVGQAALFTQDRQIFILFDDAIRTEAESLGATVAAPTWSATRLADLADSMGVAPDALEFSVGEYVRAAETGADLVCHKSPQWLRRLAPPYHVLDLRDRPFGVFTLGGLQTDIDAAVRHVDGSAIPGLYAAGRVTNGVAAWGYASGTSIGDSTFFGRRAGRAAAAR